MSLLHLARKAGRLITGRDAVLRSVNSGRAKMVLYARDYSRGAFIRFRQLTQHANIRMVALSSMAMLGKEFSSRDIGLLCLEDVNFVRGIERLL